MYRLINGETFKNLLAKEKQHDDILDNFELALKDLNIMKSEAHELQTSLKKKPKLKIKKSENSKEKEGKLENDQDPNEGENEDNNEHLSNEGNDVQHENEELFDSEQRDRLSNSEEKIITQKEELSPDKPLSDLEETLDFKQNSLEISRISEIPKDFVMEKVEEPIIENPDDNSEENDYKAPNPIHMFSSMNLEVERITMEQEDRSSRKYLEALYQLKFKQKDLGLPLKHNILKTNLFLNEPVQPNGNVQEPVKDSFTKYMANLRPIDLSKTKHRVLWSKEKVALEEQERKILAEKVKREKRQRFVKNLDGILENNKCNLKIFKPTSSLYTEFTSQPDKPIEFHTKQSILKITIQDMSLNMAGRLYPSKADIVYSNTVSHHSKMQEKVKDYIKDLRPPQIRDFMNENEKIYKDQAKVKEIWSKKSQSKNNNLHVIEEDMMHEISGDLDNKFDDSNDPLSQALQMEYLNKSTKNIEIKNEQNLRTIDFKMLEAYSKLGEVNFSMNNLSEFSMTGKIDFPNLIELRLSQNKIINLNKNLFSKTPNLQVFIADINMINSMAEIEPCKNLRHINLANNKISVISGLDKMSNLTKLELNTNKIEEISGLENCKILQHLNLGKNQI
jgi:hypothetical protein